MMIWPLLLLTIWIVRAFLEEGLREYVHLHLFLMLTQGPETRSQKQIPRQRTLRALNILSNLSLPHPGGPGPSFPITILMRTLYENPTEFPLSTTLPHKENSASQFLARKCVHGAGTAFSQHWHSIRQSQAQQWRLPKEPPKRPSESPVKAALRVSGMAKQDTVSNTAIGNWSGAWHKGREGKWPSISWQPPAQNICIGGGMWGPGKRWERHYFSGPTSQRRKTL